MIFLKPAVQLINRLRYPQKFILIGLLLALPLLLISALFVAQINQSIDFTARETLGVRYINPLISLTELLQDYHPAPGSDSSSRPETSDEALLAALAEVDAVDAELGETLGVSTIWRNVRGLVEVLMEEHGTYSNAQSMLQHISIITQIRDLILDIGNQSNLILDPDIDSYYLMDLVVNKMPTSIAYLSQIQISAVQIGTDPDRTDPERMTMLRLFVQANENNMRTGLGFAFTKTPSLENTLSSLMADRSAAIRALWAPLESSETSIASEAWRESVRTGGFIELSSNALSKSYDFYRLAAQQLNTLLHARVDRITQTRTTVVLLTGVAIVFAVYLFIAFFVSVKRTIIALETTTNKLIAGQPEEKLVLENRDELAQIATSFNNIGRELINARDKALQASRVKDEFLATMSHELRTPLNSIIGYTDILMLGMRGEVDEEARELLHFVSDSSFRLLTLINDLLDIAKIEAGRFEISNEVFNPRALIDSWATEASGLAKNSQLSFDVNIDATIPNEMYGDPVRITQIAMNLLSNAVKFTQTGGIRLDVTAEKSIWRLEVTDTGIGIPAHALEYIFDEFRQVDGTYQRAYGGTGLGLAITRKLAMMMGGRIQVKSKVGEGSTFTVTLPLRTSAVLSSEGKETLYAS
ncbi:MAG: ATP-binding protein [Anaerolineae bacterium]